MRFSYCDDICLRNITLVSILNSHTVILGYFPLHMSVEVYSFYILLTMPLK